MDDKYVLCVVVYIDAGDSLRQKKLYHQLELEVVRDGFDIEIQEQACIFVRGSNLSTDDHT